ncbi:MFS transporter [Mycolicibacterium chlorophenolicum]|uniref:Inner membrane metabolite transport protein YhjE n=1 Tax=Mycolicibacterium chlorophenolicum TaxID=37916 RepID=A0A0J6VGH6_9MYCO|nr:MFS transporter [Mycolicibacterium chlorophenolicum]KMO70100.1 Inner membrane metabolite transport protein YhjE [Mycolicibacterium chlorophenolicum]
MTTGTATATQPLWRISMSSYVGSAVEFYDFFIYGTAAALIFPTVFFPELSPMMATTASLGAFAAAFLARPVGAAVFGHFGDRISRKQTLVVTLLLMGLATVGVGLIPSTATIGVAAPLLLLFLRLVQGFAVGGEWAGAVLLSAENAPQDRRGFYGMFTQLGLGTALVLANLVFYVVQAVFGEDPGSAFFAWAWRIPFLLSGILILVALYIRMHVKDSPVHTESAHVGTPLAALFRRQGRQVLLAAGVAICAPMLVFQAGTFFTHYAADRLDFSYDLVLMVGVIGGLCAVGFAALSAILSDTYGRRRVVSLGFALTAPWAFAVFPLIETGHKLVFGVTIVVTYCLIGWCMGPLAALLPEIFDPEYRYTGAALSHTLGAIVGGALPPVVSPILLASYGGWAVSVMMGALGLVSLACVLALPETSGRTLV